MKATKAKLASLILVIFAMLMGLHSQRAFAGACTCARFNSSKDFGCRRSAGDTGARPSGVSGNGGNNCVCSNCTGMPRWSVSEPYLNLHVGDEPLSYMTSSGQKLAFRWNLVQPTGEGYSLPLVDQVPDLASSWPSWPSAYFGCNVRLNNELIPPFYESYAAADYLNDVYSSVVWYPSPVWTHNFMSEIIFWDSNWETNNTTNAVFQNGYQALALDPSGGCYYFTKNVTNQTLNPATLLTNAQTGIILQPLSSNGYPTATTNAEWSGVAWGNSSNGFQLVYPDGSKDVYGLAFYAPGLLELSFPSGNYVKSSNSTAYALLTQKVDPAGRVTQIGYEYTNVLAIWPHTNSFNTFRVRYVIDSDGRTNSFVYQTNGAVYPWQVSEVNDPFGRKATFTYGSAGGGDGELPEWDVPGQLYSITDTEGISNSFNYNGVGDGVEELSSITTPYGMTTFKYAFQTEGDTTEGYSMRAIYVSEPEGANQLYAYIHTNNVESSAVAPAVAGWDFDNGASTNGGADVGLFHRNSFYWGRSQAPNLSVYGELGTNLAAAIGNLTASDLKIGRMRHWLLDTDGISITEALSSERDPSPDSAGSIEGQRTWFAYTNTGPADVFTSPNIGCIAQTLPDGTSQYTRYSYYPSGLVGTNEQSCAFPDGSIGELATSFYYNNGNNVDLTEVANSIGQSVNVVYNTRHEPLHITNALGYVTTLAWDSSSGNLTSVVLPTGQSISLTYYPSNTGGVITNTNSFLESVTVQPENRVTTITDYTNALPRIIHATGTAVPDLWITNMWDGLSRLVWAGFQDGTSISNIYTILDLGAHKDRVNNWTTFDYDGLEHLIAVTNALGNATRYGWCSCGSLTSITNALGYVTHLNRDNQDRLISVVFPDTSSLTNQYDLTGRLTNQLDGLGNWRRYMYNIQDQVVQVQNSAGQIYGAAYDPAGRVVLATNANGVVVSNSFDLLNRLTERRWLAGSNIYFLYSSNGLIAFTNQDGHWTHFGRDAAGHLTALTNAAQTESFTYNGLDELASLTDGNGHTTSWTYNQYGWLTNKGTAANAHFGSYGYDSNGRMTSRSQGGANTSITYDAVGNRTCIFSTDGYTDFNGFTNLYYYDAVHELTNMVDASGTTAFTWTAMGHLASESSPWGSGTMTYGYNQGHRTNLSLSQPSGSWSQSYSYDSSWRMTGIASPAGSFGYSYPAGANQYQVGGISLPNGASIANSYDNLSRLTSTALADHWGHVLDGYAYGLDTMGLRTNMTRQLGMATNSVTIGYDGISELTSWAGKESSGQPRLNEQLHYGYDAAGNMLYRSNNWTYLSIGGYNNINEPSNYAVYGSFTATGSLSAPATNVTVNGYAAEIYSDLTFANTNVAVDYGYPIYFTNVAQNIYGSKTTNQYDVNWVTAFGYNPDGSTEGAGGTELFYDSLGRATDISAYSGPTLIDNRLTLDGLGRLRSVQQWQLVYEGPDEGNTWVYSNEVRYIYDGMTVVQERDSNNVPLVTYTRGLDMSESLQGAGGIGGLLARTDSNGPAFYHADGNGNITALMDSYQRIAARYEYDPYGRLLGKWGRLADANTYRFSSKEYFPNTGLYNFGFRFYMPEMARWLNRDPIQEAGGVNLYGFVGNNPVNVVDPYGLDFWQSQYSVVYQGPPISSYSGSDFADAIDDVTSAAVQSSESTSTTGNFMAYMTQSVASGLADMLRLGQGTADATSANNGWDQAIGIAQDVVRATGLFDLLGGLGIGALPKPCNLHRPYIRQGVMDDVKARAPRAPDGRFIDPNTLQPTDDPVLGHKPGYEFWRLKAAAEAENVSQQMFNETLNNPEFYQIEDKAVNASHQYEQP